MSSTDSSQTDQVSNSQEPSEAIQGHLESEADLTRLTRLLGSNSIRRNLETEDEMIRRDMALNESLIFGTEPMLGDNGEKGSGEMEIIAARDVHVTTNAAPATQAIPSVQQAREPSSQAETTEKSNAIKTALVALAVSLFPALGTLAGVYGMIQGIKGDQQQVVEPDSKAEVSPKGSLELLPP